MKRFLIVACAATLTLSACGQAGSGPGDARDGAQQLHPGDAARQGLNVLGRTPPPNGTDVRTPTLLGAANSWRF